MATKKKARKKAAPRKQKPTEATEIEIKSAPEGEVFRTADGKIHWYQLFIRGSVVEGVEVDKVPLNQDYFMKNER